MRALQLAHEHLQAIEGTSVVGIVPGGPQTPAHPSPVVLGQVVCDVALLVTDAALHRRPLAEHVAHGPPQGPRAVEYAEHPLGRGEAALDQIGQ